MRRRCSFCPPSEAQRGGLNLRQDSQLRPTYHEADIRVLASETDTQAGRKSLPGGTV